MRRSRHDTGVPEPEPEVFDSAIVPIAMTAGSDHLLVYYNDAFRALFGTRTLGAPAREAFGEPAAAPFVAMLDDVFRDRTARQVTSPRRTDGSTPGAPGIRHFVYSCSPMESRHGPGVLTVAIDTTAQVEAAERAQLLSEERHQALQRYEALMSAVSQIVWLLQPNGEIEELVGGFEEFAGIPWRPVIDQEWLSAVHPHDRNRLVRSWREAAEDPAAMFVCSFRMRTASGVYRRVQSRAVPIVRDGVTVEWIGTTADIEDQWRNRLRERLRARVATVIAANDVPQAFSAVTAAVVPELTDVCAVFLLPPADLPGPDDIPTATRVAATAREGLPELPPLSGLPRPVGAVAQQVIESRRPRLFTFPAGEPPADVLPDLSRGWLREARATSITMVPIVIDAAVVAFAVAAGCADSPPPGPADLQMFGEVVQEVRDPLRQAMELQRTRHMALTLQRALLTPTPEVAGAELAAQYQPASTAAEIGGDWYDSLLLPDGSVTLSIGDIAGHDMEAATSMSQLRSMLRVIVFDRSGQNTPAECLARLDRVAEGLAIAPLVTAVHARLEPRPGGRWHGSWSNAGHPPPLLLSASAPPRFLEGDGPDLPLCVAPWMARTTRHLELHPGDTLLLYTDGLIEVPGTDLTEGMAALAEHAEQGRVEGLPLAMLCERLLAAAADRRDDAAVIGFRPISQGRVWPAARLA